jgi:hypothetical protein
VSFSIFSHLLVAERHRQRAASEVGFSIPVMSERFVPPEAEPLLATTARGRFIRTPRNQEGMARYGIFPCPLEEEPLLLGRLHEALWECSEAEGWANRFSTVGEALDFMRASPYAPKILVLPESVLAQWGAQETIVGELEGMLVLSSTLPVGMALLTAHPASVGVYTRVGDHLGLQLTGVNHTVAVVRADGLD